MSIYFKKSQNRKKIHFYFRAESPKPNNNDSFGSQFWWDKSIVNRMPRFNEKNFEDFNNNEIPTRIKESKKSKTVDSKFNSNGKYFCSKKLFLLFYFQTKFNSEYNHNYNVVTSNLAEQSLILPNRQYYFKEFAKALKFKI
jgi:hypothetical protein